MSTVTRNSLGRFQVQLPFKNPRPSLGSSLNIAMKRLHFLERRLQANPSARKEYNKFMQEYEDLGHMEEVQPVDSDSGSTCYIPHQFIIKESSSTTKFRVVFDASAKKSNGKSLNEEMLVGPTIQDSLVDILIRFRLHKVAITADIEKMYRQILVSPKDTDLQRILWRDDPSKPIKNFRLRTVTCGTAGAPYLATRTLKELGIRNQRKFPIASEVIIRDFYMDDLMSGEPDVKQALETQHQLLELMNDGSLCLRKWSSNSQAVLDAVPPEMRETQSLLSFDQDSSIKTLGICWNPKTDQFLFQISPQIPTTKPLSKRIVLSEIARLFDPIGWLAPIIISAKIPMQSLWKLQQGWDDRPCTTLLGQNNSTTTFRKGNQLNQFWEACSSKKQGSLPLTILRFGRNLESRWSCP
ncbi:uncharacterized protein LOC110854790 [Folsomia candida]|uniref:uncharacterized protein LOC110854790 n=1 Tax=Folsomia candida TaxID=158441 RepID=UPI000B8F91BA|nr:uncharacterized protein LOC110854790 [Folsomia candida]